MTTLSPRRWVVRELPYLRGSRLRIIDRFDHFCDAMGCAQELSREHRQLAVELQGQDIAVFIDGREVLNRPA